MEHFAGLDVSVKETSVCIVDDAGRVIREVKVASTPETLMQVLMAPTYHLKRVGLEAGPLSQWLFSGLAEANVREPVSDTDTGVVVSLNALDPKTSRTSTHPCSPRQSGAKGA
jgi:hypothetical protein